MKKGKFNATWLILGALIFVVVAGALYFGLQMSGIGPAADAATKPDDAVSVDFTVTDALESTIIAGATLTIYQDGIPLSGKTAGTAWDMPPGSSYRALVNPDDGGAGHYNLIIEGTIPNVVGQETYALEDAGGPIKVGDAYAGSFDWVSVKNHDDSTQNCNTGASCTTNNQSIGAGLARNFYITLAANSTRDYTTNPSAGFFVFACSASTAVYDFTDWTLSYNGATADPYTVNGLPGSLQNESATRTYNVKWTVPVVMSGGQEVKLKLRVKAISGQDPTHAHDITCKAFDVDAFQNYDGTFQYGVEDINHNNLAVATEVTRTLNTQ